MELQLPLLQLNGQRLPSFKRTIAALGIIPEIIYRALEFGTSQNRTFFEQLSEDEIPRPHIREMIVRDQGKRFLERNEFQVEDESVDVGNEPLASLVVRCGSAQLRVLKGPDGVTPGCGTSPRRRRFYNQASDFYRTRDGKVRQTRLNLIFLWEFDKAFNLGNVWLVCPMRAGETSADVVTFWHEKLPHPATIMRTVAEEPDARQKAEEELDHLLRNEPEADEEKGSEQA